MSTYWLIGILGAVLYSAAAWLLLRFNRNAHTKPTPKPDKPFDILELEKLWRTR
jgi:hypothetical protein